MSQQTHPVIVFLTLPACMDPDVIEQAIEGG
jgi:hypothetical protein